MEKRQFKFRRKILLPTFDFHFLKEERKPKVFFVLEISFLSKKKETLIGPLCLHFGPF
jgi:hypothetical protein